MSSPVLCVVGIKPPTDKWKRMKAVWDACAQAGMDPPTEVSKFFRHEPPDPKGVVLSQKDLGDTVSRWEEDGGYLGFEIDVKKLPPDVTIIRVYNSW